MEHPSGQQFILRHGEQQPVITEVGGGLRSYRIGDVDVLDGFDDTEICEGARGQPCCPGRTELGTVGTAGTDTTSNFR